MTLGRVYVWSPDPVITLGGHVAASVEPLLRLDGNGSANDRLCGRYVRVVNRGAFKEADPAGRFRSVPIGDARPNTEGDFLFEPVRGGGRMDRVLEAVPELRALRTSPESQFRWRYIQASHFGEVNTYFHLDRIAAYIDALLNELSASPLPQVTAVVNAHNAVTECDGARDGVRRDERWVPFQGGHYRLPSRRNDIREYIPVSFNGEIHLGPGRQLVEHGALAAAAGGRYRANASHNAGILYHEYGHHLTRHTADFRANALRLPQRQNNRKTALDEGFCDYWAATMLQTPHIWCWHRRHDQEEVHPRSLSSSKTTADYDASSRADPHANGTIWAAALWDLRTRLGATEPDGIRQTDLLVVKTLLLLGRLGVDEPDAKVKSVRHARADYTGALASLLDADELLYSSRHRSTILATFSRRGIQPAMMPESAFCCEAES